MGRRSESAVRNVVLHMVRDLAADPKLGTSAAAGGLGLKLFRHFHLHDRTVQATIKPIFIRSQDSTRSFTWESNYWDLLEQPRFRKTLLHLGYKLYVPVLEAAAESGEQSKIEKVLVAMEEELLSDPSYLRIDLKKYMLVQWLSLARWFVALVATKKRNLSLVLFALRYSSTIVEIAEDAEISQEVHRMLRPWRYYVLCFLLDVNDDDDRERTNTLNKWFVESRKDPLNDWIFHYIAAIGSKSKKLMDFIRQNNVHPTMVADPKNQMGCTPMEVAVHYDNVEAIKYFLDCKEFQGELGVGKMDELIGYAAREGSICSMEELLESRAKEKGNIMQLVEALSMLTPLHLAALNGHAGMIKVLRGKGNQNPNQPCTSQAPNWTPKHVLPPHQLQNLETIDDWLPASSFQFDVCRRSLVSNASLWYPAGFTALHFAVVFGGRECVEALLCGSSSDVGHAPAADSSSSIWRVDIWVEDEEGLSPFDWAVAVDEYCDNCSAKYASSSTSSKLLQDILIDYDAAQARKENNSDAPYARREQQWASSWSRNYGEMKQLMTMSERMKRQKARVLHEKARKSVKEKERWEWENDMAMAFLQRNWDVARFLAKHVFDGMVDDDAYDDPAILMLHALEAADTTNLEPHGFMRAVDLKTLSISIMNLHLMPNKIAVERVLLELFSSITEKLRLRNHDGINTSSAVPQCLGTAMRYGMEALAVRIVTEGQCEVLANDILKDCEDMVRDKMPRLVNAMEQRPDVRRALYEDRQVYVDYANTLLVGAALIGGLAYQGWLQPPLGYDDYSGKLKLTDKFARVFAHANNFGFMFAMGTVLTAALGAAPLLSGDLGRTKRRARTAVLWASIFLAVSIVCVVVAFTSAEATVLSHRTIPFLQNYFVFNFAFTALIFGYFTYRLSSHVMTSVSEFWVSLTQKLHMTYLSFSFRYLQTMYIYIL